MASAKTIKAKTKSIRNIQKMTEALEKVSATKLTKGLLELKNSEVYYYTLASFMQDIQLYLEELDQVIEHPILKRRDTGKSLIVCITSNRGLCGGYNGTIWRSVKRLVRAFTEQKQDYAYYIIGKKGVQFAEFSGLEVFQSRIDFSESKLLEQSRALADELMALFLEGDYRDIQLVYHGYSSGGQQQVRTERFLPFEFKKSKKSIDRSQNQDSPDLHELYIFEPNAQALLEKLIPELFRAYSFYILIQTQAAEHFARSTAMKQAYNSAKDLAEQLTLEYNRIRQNKITNEIIEIMGITNV